MAISTPIFNLRPPPKKRALVKIKSFPSIKFTMIRGPMTPVCLQHLSRKPQSSLLICGRVLPGDEEHFRQSIITKAQCQGQSAGRDSLILCGQNKSY